MVTSSFHLYFCSSQFISFCVSVLSWVDELNKLACSPCMGLHSSVGGALQRPWVRILLKPRKSFFGLPCNCLNCDSLRWSHLHFIDISAVHNSFHCVIVFRHMGLFMPEMMMTPSFWLCPRVPANMGITIVRFPVKSECFSVQDCEDHIFPSCIPFVSDILFRCSLLLNLLFQILCIGTRTQLLNLRISFTIHLCLP